MSIPGMLCRVFCGGSCCGCCCAYPGERGVGLFPRTEKELKRFGAPWLTKVMTESGVLTHGATVSNLTIESANEGGLLGEMCKLYISYSGATKAPTTLMVMTRDPYIH
jgi:hypothetical protein